MEQLPTLGAALRMARELYSQPQRFSDAQPPEYRNTRPAMTETHAAHILQLHRQFLDQAGDLTDARQRAIERQRESWIDPAVKRYLDRIAIRRP